MSEAKTFHIEIDEESDFSFRFHYVNHSTGLPVDVTGFRAEMHVKGGYAGNQSPEPLLVFTSQTGGGILLGGALGTVDIFICYEDTMNKHWDRAFYNLVLINPKGGRIVLSKGFFTINRSPTLIRSTLLPDVSSSNSPHPNNLGEGGLDGDGS